MSEPITVGQFVEMLQEYDQDAMMEVLFRPRFKGENGSYSIFSDDDCLDLDDGVLRLLVDQIA